MALAGSLKRPDIYLLRTLDKLESADTCLWASYSPKLSRMTFFRQTKKRTFFLWTLFLSVALLCVQGVKLHVHNFSHDHDQQHSHITIEEKVEHSHLSAAHLSTDTSHGDYHHEMVSELDVSPSGLLKKFSNSFLILALFATVLVLLFPSFYQPKFYRRRGKDTSLSWRYLLFPPLRAPPL